METPQRKQVFTLLTAVAIVVWFVAANHYHKFSQDAKWFGLSVFWWAFLLCIIVAWIMSLSQWWRTNWNESSYKLILIPFTALIISTIGGTYMTEPVENGGLTQNQLNQSKYNYADSRSGEYYYYLFGNRSTSSNTSTSSSSSGSGRIKIDDDGAEALVIVFLVALAVIIVLASLFIPHFWVVGGLMLITAMVMVTLRESREV